LGHEPAGPAATRPRRRRLRDFEADHRRHVRDLRQCLESLGEGELAGALEPAAPLLPIFARMAAPLGAHSMIMTLLNNEQLTNLSYEDALAYDWDEESGRILERNRADEERHFEWLAAKHDELAEEEGEEGDSEPPGASA
jgi:hypothetical protein